MYVIKKLMLNKFQPRPIVSNKALYISMGAKPATIVSKDTAECFSEPTPDGASKLKTLGLAAEISRVAYEKHNTAGKSEDLEIRNAKDY